MKRLIFVLLLLGCPMQDPPKADPCDTTPGKHCGCAARDCTAPCSSCCDGVLPCPPATCGGDL